jgi:hypothetical protein
MVTSSMVTTMVTTENGQPSGLLMVTGKVVPVTILRDPHPSPAVRSHPPGAAHGLLDAGI